MNWSPVDFTGELKHISKKQKISIFYSFFQREKDKKQLTNFFHSESRWNKY